MIYRSICLFLVLLSCCHKAEHAVVRDPIASDIIEIYGVVNDGFLMECNYSVRSDEGAYGLDVFLLPSQILGKPHLVKARKLMYGNVPARLSNNAEFLTEVTIDGTRYPTIMEWNRAHQQRPDSEDPFLPEDFPSSK